MTPHGSPFRYWPALVISLASIIAGGLVSAVTAHAATQSASWASAYLVLVGGVGTGGLAVGRALFTQRHDSAPRLWTELTLWSAGNALVLAGTLTGPAWLVEVGSTLLVLTLALVLVAVVGGAGARPLRGLFMLLVTILLVSIPIGVVLSHLSR